jgi:molybdate transport system ATP-binding protein
MMTRMMLDADLHLAQGKFSLAARFSAPDGITALFGPSGAGKSTLLSALAGLKAAAGRITLNGKSVESFKPHQRGFGLVFQDARLFPHLTVGGNLAYAHRRAPPRFAIPEVAAFFDIANFLDRPVGNLSGGEKGRVALARALVAAPDFLLLDEPFAALDGARRRAFLQVLRRTHHKYKIPMLVVTHNIDEAAALASHLIALDGGKVVAEGAFADVARQPQFQALLDGRDIGAVLPPSALRSAKEEMVEGYWLRADHVLLAARRPEAISARNILESRITGLTSEDDGSLLVELETASSPLLARVTAEAAQELALAVGKTAWAVIKAHAV